MAPVLKGESKAKPWKGHFPIRTIVSVTVVGLILIIWFGGRDTDTSSPSSSSTSNAALDDPVAIKSQPLSQAPDSFTRGSRTSGAVDSSDRSLGHDSLEIKEGSAGKKSPLKSNSGGATSVFDKAGDGEEVVVGGGGAVGLNGSGRKPAATPGFSGGRKGSETRFGEETTETVPGLEFSAKPQLPPRTDSEVSKVIIKTPRADADSEAADSASSGEADEDSPMGGVAASGGWLKSSPEENSSILPLGEAVKSRGAGKSAQAAEGSEGEEEEEGEESNQSPKKKVQASGRERRKAGGWSRSSLADLAKSRTLGLGGEEGVALKEEGSGEEGEEEEGVGAEGGVRGAFTGKRSRAAKDDVRVYTTKGGMRAPEASDLDEEVESEEEVGPTDVVEAGRVRITGTGAWKLGEGYKFWLDAKLAKALGKFLANKTVLELGAGTGHYTRIIEKTAASIDGYDGVFNIANLTKGYIKHADLTQRHKLGVHDWVLCLETGVHVPAEFELQVFDNIHRHNREGVILSWAVIGQNGKSHVNNHSNKYIKDLMKSLGYENDKESEKLLRSQSTLRWFKSTLMVFRRNYEHPKRR